MLVAKHTVKTKASATNIWNIWTDVRNWNTWDHGIEFSSIEGPFAAGTVGRLKPKGGPLVSTKLTKVEPKRSFVDESKLFFSRIVVSHYITKTAGSNLVTHQIEMTGPLAFLFYFLIGRKMKKNLPIEMKAMLEKAENLQKKEKEDE